MPETLDLNREYGEVMGMPGVYYTQDGIYFDFNLAETQPVSVVSSLLPVGAATSAKQDLLLAELQLKADLTETQKTKLVGAAGEDLVHEGAINASSYLESVGHGAIAGHSLWSTRAYSPNSTTTESTVWPPGTQYVFPTGATAMEIVSSNAADSAAGTGVRTVYLEYLDINYVEKSHTFTMNGTTPVAGPTDIFRINRMFTLTAGTGGKAAGNINVRLVGGAATIYCQIATGTNTRRASFYTVPAGRQLYIKDINICVVGPTAGKVVRVILHSSYSPFGANSNTGTLFWPQFEVLLVDSNIARDSFPIRVIEKTDIKFSIIGEAGAQITTALGGWTEAYP